MNHFDKWLPVFFVLFCVSFGVAVCSLQIGTAEPCVAQSQIIYEVWTDKATGHSFLVAMPRWRDGIGICLIPSFAAEEKEVKGVPEPKVLESVVDWPERN